MNIWCVHGAIYWECPVRQCIEAQPPPPPGPMYYMCLTCKHVGADRSCPDHNLASAVCLGCYATREEALAQVILER